MMKKLTEKVKIIMDHLLTLLVNISILSSKAFIKFFEIFKKINFFIKSIRRVLGESLFALLICAIGDLIAGIVLGKMTHFLEAYPGLIVLIPGAIGMRGNIFGALGSRLGSNLHIGTLSTELKKSKILNENIEATIILTIIMSLFLGLMAWILCEISNFKNIGIIDFTIISVMGGIISGIFLLPATILIALKSYENGWDPDNITTPLIAASGDLFTLPSLFLAILFLELVKNTILESTFFLLFILIGALGLLIGLKGDEYLKSIISQSVPVLLLCSIFGTSAGSILNSKLSTILDNPSILALVPLFSGESGDLVSILGARLSSGLHSGIIPATLIPRKGALHNFGIILILSIIIYPVIGVLAHLVSAALGLPTIPIHKMLLISALAGYLLTPFLLILGFYLNSLSYRRELDPDNVVVPLSTSLTDPMANLCLVLMIILFLNV